MLSSENFLLIIFSLFVIFFLSFLVKKVMANTSETIPHNPITETATGNDEEVNSKRLPLDSDLQTIKDFGYRFNDEGELRDIETDEFYNFNYVEGDQKLNQKRYEKLGNVITEYVYDLLEGETKLKRVYIPEDAEENEARSFIFMTDDALTNPDKLMILIHGSGAVRAGQWSRKLIINDNLDKGSQLPYVKRGIKQGYGVIILNSNLNKIKLKDGKEHTVRKNENAEKHGHYVWKTFVQKAKAKNIAIVAHSYGGIVTLELANEFKEDFLSRVFAIAFTDSVHSVRHQELDEDLVDLIKSKAINYVSSSADLGTPERAFEKHDCPRVASGTNQHELTSWSCMEYLFDFLNDQYTKVSGKTDNANSRETSYNIKGYSTQNENSNLETEAHAEVGDDIEMNDGTQNEKMNTDAEMSLKTEVPVEMIVDDSNENESTEFDAERAKDSTQNKENTHQVELDSSSVETTISQTTENPDSKTFEDTEIQDEKSSTQTERSDSKDSSSFEQKDSREDAKSSEETEGREIQEKSSSGGGDGVGKTFESKTDDTKAEKKDDTITKDEL